MKSILALLCLMLCSCSTAPAGVKTYSCFTPNGPVQYQDADAWDHVTKGQRTVTFTDPGTGSTLEIPFTMCVLLTKR